MLPSSVTSIGDRAFANTTNIKELTVGYRNVVLGNNVFEGWNNSQKIWVPFADKDELDSNSGWEGKLNFTDASNKPSFLYIYGFFSEEDEEPVFTFKPSGSGLCLTSIRQNVPSVIFIPRDYEGKLILEIGDGVSSILLGNDKVTEIQFASNSAVTTINKNAFYEATKLTKFQYPSSLTTIKEEAFAKSGLSGAQNLSTSKVSGSNIGSGAFMDCKNITSFNFNSPNTKITVLPTNFAKGCTKLTSITYYTDSSTGISLTTIGESAFENTGFTSISLDENFKSLAEIKKNAYKNCNSLKTFSFPSIDSNATLKTLGEGILENCPNLTTISNLEKQTTITSLPVKFAKDDVKLTSVNTTRIKTISDEAFSGCKALITLHNNTTDLAKVLQLSTFTTIGQNAFTGCTSFISFRIDSTVPTVGSNAFLGCEAIPFMLKDSTKFGIYASSFLKDLSNLYTIIMPVEESSTASDINKFKPNAWNENQAKIQWLENPNYIIINGKVELTPAGRQATSITIKEKDVVLSDYFAQNCSKLESITFENGLKSLSKFAFQNCTKLSKFEVKKGTSDFENGYGFTVIPNNCFEKDELFPFIPNFEKITSIGYHAFWGCTNISFDVWPDYLNFIGTDGLALTNITQMHFPETIKDHKIPASALDRMHSVEKVTMADNIVSIGTFAFWENKKLTEIAFPAQCATFGNSVLATTTSLQKITWPKVKFVLGSTFMSGSAYQFNSTNRIPKTLDACHSNGSLGGITFNGLYFETGTTKIADYLTKGTSGITTIELPPTLEVVGQYALSGIPNATFTSNSYKLPNSLVRIEKYGFQNAAKLSITELPSSLTHIGSYAFENCNGLQLNTTKLEKLTNLTNDLGADNKIIEYGIGDYAFKNCPSVIITKIPSNLEGKLGKGVFSKCPISSIDLSAIKNLPAYTFSECTSLKTITGLDKLETIGSYAFNGCTAISSSTLNLSNSSAKIEERAFKGCTTLSTLNLTNSSVVIGPYAFDGCNISSLTTTNNKITTFGKNAFGNCTKLKTFNFNEFPQVKEISEGMFVGCTILDTITLSSNIESIGARAFNGTPIKKFDFTLVPKVKAINTETFKDCASLSKVVLSENITSIGKNAFNGCNALTALYIVTPNANNLSSEEKNNYFGNDWVMASGLSNVTKVYFVTEKPNNF